MKDNCDEKCTHCNETQLPNIRDKNCDGIGYSYAYKTDCAGDRYIKIDEVRYLLRCERNKAIDDVGKALLNEIYSQNIKMIIYGDGIDTLDTQIFPYKLWDNIAEQLKAGENSGDKDK